MVAEPAGVVTWIGPLVAPAGTVSVIWLAELTVKVAGVPSIVTELAPVSAEPLRVTAVPAWPLVGANEVSWGSGGGGGVVTVKLPVLAAVPAGVVTWIGPLVAPAGTVSVIWLAELTVKVAGVPSM